MADSTKKLYDRHIEKLLVALGLDTIPEQSVVDAWIESQPIVASSKKTYYTAILYKLGTASPKYEGFRVKMRTLGAEVDAKAKEQHTSLSEDAKWLCWEDILKARDALKPEDSANYWKYQDWVICCLYTMLPPLRADYSPMRVYDKEPEEQNKGNYMVCRPITLQPPIKVKGGGRLVKKTPATIYIVLNEYKTAGKYGRQVIQVPPELQTILFEFRIINPTEWLLVKESGEPYDEVNLSQRVSRIMERATGKAAGISIFRHSYETFMLKGQMPLKKREEIAKGLLHSSSMSELYRRVNKE